MKEKKTVIEKLAAEVEVHLNSIAALKKSADIQNYTTKVKKNDVAGEISSLQKVIAHQKRTIQERKEYVHPMFVEDLRDHIARLNDKIAAMDKKSKHVIEHYDEMEEETKRCRRLMEINQLEVERISKRSEVMLKEVADLKEEARRLKLEK